MLPAPYETAPEAADPCADEANVLKARVRIHQYRTKHPDTKTCILRLEALGELNCPHVNQRQFLLWTQAADLIWRFLGHAEESGYIISKLQ